MDKAIDKVTYRGKRIKVYADDYGQCYYFLYNGKQYGCGAYNFDYLGEIVSVVDDDLDEVFHVMPEREHRPSARVYKRHGVWYCDYFKIEGFPLSYGDLLKKKDRPTRDDLIKEAKLVMNLADGCDEGAVPCADDDGDDYGPGPMIVPDVYPTIEDFKASPEYESRTGKKKGG